MKILFCGPVNELGYGVHFCELGLALKELGEKSGHTVDLFNLSRPTSFGPTSRPHCGIVKDLCIAERALQSHYDVGIALWHANDNSRCREVLRCHRKVLMTVWETSLPRVRTLQSLAPFEFLFVPTNWQRKTIQDPDLLQATHVVPEGGSSTANASIILAPIEARLLLSVGKYEKRKGQNSILLALQHIRKDLLVPVEALVGIWGNPFDRSWATSLCRQASICDYKMLDAFTKRKIISEVSHGDSTVEELLAPSIGMLPRGDRAYLPVFVLERINYLDLLRLQRSAYAGVFAHAGEGWCLPLAEQLCEGGHVIAPNSSGPSDYLGLFPSRWIPVATQTEPAYDGQFFRGPNGDWWPVENFSLVDALHRLSRSGPAIVNPHDTNPLSWEMSAQILLSKCQEVLDGKSS